MHVITYAEEYKFPRNTMKLCFSSAAKKFDAEAYDYINLMIISCGLFSWMPKQYLSVSVDVRINFLHCKQLDKLICNTFPVQ